MKTKLLATAVAAGLLVGGGTVAADEADGWKYTGQGVVYYQTADGWGNGSLFDQGPASDTSGWATAAAGIQLGAVNKNIGKGFGAGVELSGISSLGLEDNIVYNLAHSAGGLNNGAITQAYVTYASGKTSMKMGRQHLPKSLSPFAFTEGWNVFKNGYEALLVVNSDIKDTTIVYANVWKANNSVGDLNGFSDLHGAKGGANMITAQNKSFKGVTLTGSYYWIPDISVGATYNGDADALWVDAGFNISKVAVGLQGGYIKANLDGGVDEQVDALGVKVSGKINKVGWSAAYSSVSDSDHSVLALSNIAGGGIKTPLYTQGVLNQNAIKRDSNTFRITAAIPGAGGKFIVAYSSSDLGATALESVFGSTIGEGTYNELDLIYKGKFAKNLPYFVAFVNQNDDRLGSDDSQNFFRFWVKYNF
ncbi:MAG: hypothetical protein GY808_19670 [Gammaproteobacteria bacterium]|nr:hypothetical protein [Gammaproteobacteria bacterium]